jgi:hypothetical protein
MDNNLSSNLALFQTQFQDTLMFNLNPIINSLPIIEQILKLLLFLENRINGVDIESLNQIPRSLTNVENKILDKMSPLLTLDNFLNNHNTLMSFL